MELTVAAQSRLVQVDVGDEAPVFTVDAIGNFHLVDAADFVQHHLRVLNVVFVKQFLSLGAIWAVSGAEDCGLPLSDDFSQASCIRWLANCREE